MNILMKLVHQYMAIFFNFSPTSNHLHPLQVENCDGNSRLVVDEDDNGKLRPERVKGLIILAAVYVYHNVSPGLRKRHKHGRTPINHNQRTFGTRSHAIELVFVFIVSGPGVRACWEFSQKFHAVTEKFFFKTLGLRSGSISGH